MLSPQCALHVPEIVFLSLYSVRLLIKYVEFFKNGREGLERQTLNACVRIVVLVRVLFFGNVRWPRLHGVAYAEPPSDHSPRRKLVDGTTAHGWHLC